MLSVFILLEREYSDIKSVQTAKRMVAFRSKKNIHCVFLIGGPLEGHWRAIGGPLAAAGQ